jgi:hypothetical protein
MPPATHEVDRPRADVLEALGAPGDRGHQADPVSSPAMRACAQSSLHRRGGEVMSGRTSPHAHVVQTLRPSFTD